MKNSYVPHITIITSIIIFLLVLFWSYGNYNEKKALCNERGGVLVNDAQGLEKYICIDKQSVIAW